MRYRATIITRRTRDAYSHSRGDGFSKRNARVITEVSEGSKNCFVTIQRSLGAAAAHFSPWSRSLLTVVFLAWCISRTFLMSVLLAPPHIDERTWVDRSLRPLWSGEYHLQRYYATHHPSLARLVYRAVLNTMGVYECDRPLVVYGLDSDRRLELLIETRVDSGRLVEPIREPLVRYAEGMSSIELNLARGALPTLEVQMALRSVNVLFLAGMVAFIYLGLKRIFANRVAALAGTLPVIFSYPLHSAPAPFTALAPYIGVDSMLLFWLSVFWYIWLRVKDESLPGVLLLGAVGGLMVSTKVNGAFVLIGAGLYLLLALRGGRRILFPALLGAVAFGVFILLNPIYRAGDLAWMARRLRDVITLMYRLKHLTAQQEWGRFTRAEVMAYTFPYWIFYLPVTALVVRTWRQRWMRITVAWALPMILLNWFLIYVPFPRYAAPMAVAFLVLFAVAGIPMVTESLTELAEKARLPIAGEDATDER